MEYFAKDAYSRIASDAMNRERNLPGLISLAKDNAALIRFAEDGSPMYGQISLKKNPGLDRLLLNHGFKLVDFRRGSAWFGGTRRHDVRI